MNDLASSPSSAHVSDSDLIRMIDDEPVSAAVREHVDGCAECAARLDRYRRRSRSLSVILRQTEPEPVDSTRLLPPVDDLSRRRARKTVAAPAWWTRPAVRAAAILVAVAGLAVAAPPVRHWVVEHAFQHSGIRSLEFT